MGYNAAPLEKLIEEFSKFPGIGRKGATRMAYQVLRDVYKRQFQSWRCRPRPGGCPASGCPPMRYTGLPGPAGRHSGQTGPRCV